MITTEKSAASGTLLFEGPDYTLEFLSRFPSSHDEQQNTLYALQSVFSKSDLERAAQCGALLTELEVRRKARQP